MKLRLAFALALLMTQSGCLIATDQRPFLRLESDAATQYNQRGMVRNDRAVVQSAMDVELQTEIEGWVNVRVWGNLDIHNSTGDAWFSEGQGGRFTEIDTSISYTEEYRGLLWTFGLLSTNPMRGPSFPFAVRSASAEMFLTAEKKMELLTPRLEAHWDFDEADDGYFVAGASNQLELTETIALVADLSVGYSGSDHSQWNYGTGHSGLSDLTGSLTGLFAYSPTTKLRAQLAGSTILDHDIAGGIQKYGIATDNLWLSIGIEWAR